MRILVIAGETADLGPRATLQGLCRALRATSPDVELSSTLADVGGEDAPESMRGERALYAAARGSDLVLVTNDGLGAPRSRRAALLRLLALRGTPLSGVALVHERVATASTRLLRGFRRLTVADEPSLRALDARGIAGASVLPDPAMLVPAAPTDAARAALGAAGAPLDGTPLLGVAARAVHLPDERDEAIAARYVDLLARALDHAIDAHGAFVVCLPGRAADGALLAALAGALQSDRACILPMLAPSSFKGVATELTALVAGHRRAALLGASVGRPTVGLGDSGALASALARAGREHAYLDAGLFVRGGLVAHLDELVTNAMETRRASVVSFEELKVAARGGIRALLAGAD